MARRRTERVIQYEPLASQKVFHESKARFKGFSGPIGSGKSQALCQEAIKLAYLNQGRMGLIGAPTYPMLRDTTQMALVEVLDQNQLPYDLNKAENVLTLKDTGSRMVFRAVDDFERLRGSNLAWFGLDELTYCPEDAWLRLEGRLRDPRAKRLCGFAVWTPKGYDWVYRRFILQPVEGYEVIVAKPFENRYLLDRVPDFYTRLERSYDERFFRQEVMGEYLAISGGRVYYAFERGTHIAELEVKPELPLKWALDFNVNPMCSVVAQIEGELVLVLDEIVLPHASTQEACAEFAARFPRHPSGITVYGDASGNRMQTAGTSDYRIVREFFRQAGYGMVAYKVPAANPLVRERVVMLNAKLRTAAGEKHLLVNRKCAELIKDLEEVSYKADSNVIDKDKDPRRTHLSDALGYLVWQECLPQAPVGEQSQRLF